MSYSQPSLPANRAFVVQFRAQLTDDPTRDQLGGVYFQAALQQRFDVVFVRIQ
jgi:hypothetical protein